jgi:predicted permease
MAGSHPLANYRWVSPAYFQTMGISLLQGRTFQESERGRKVAIIAERVAKRFWPDENPLGKQFYPGDDSKPLVEVIGVVADIRTVRLDQEPILMVYLPYWEPGFNGRILGASTFVLGTFGDPGSLAGSVRAAIHDVDSQVPLPRMRPMAQVVNDSVAGRQFQMQVAVAFAACALFLACLGIYGVVSYSVTQRRNELGLRMALGCQPAGLRWMVMRQGMKPVFAGLMAGVAGALALGRVVSSLLFGVTASDPRIFLVTIIILGGVGGVACYLPALRASRTDPMVALRYD